MEVAYAKCPGTGPGAASLQRELRWELCHPGGVFIWAGRKRGTQRVTEPEPSEVSTEERSEIFHSHSAMSEVVRSQGSCYELELISGVHLFANLGFYFPICSSFSFHKTSTNAITEKNYLKPVWHIFVHLFNKHPIIHIMSGTILRTLYITMTQCRLIHLFIHSLQKIWIYFVKQHCARNKKAYDTFFFFSLMGLLGETDKEISNTMPVLMAHTAHVICPGG